ncbi:MAG TPA: hypothetical protein VJS67_06895 [Pseudonocardiaceae bacterium]|nr:hypothetical protein [Pseudonocardiaceae bacterium]
MRPSKVFKQPIGISLLGLGLVVADGLAVAPVATADTSAANFARQILAERDQGKISIADYSAEPARDRADRSLTSQQLEDIAAGQPAHLSTRCSYAAQYPPSKSIEPDVRVLQFLADLGQQSPYKINVLFGQCHRAGASSLHHQGKAVDLGCPLNTTTPDSVGRQYGVTRNSETCAADQHVHYSVGGR